MQDIIHLLPDSVANQIAAGEVVQRPASVVKELMENAIDAGATKVQVIVSDGGRTLIQVIDDGAGMSETDARLAFERHATSKINNAEDLFALRTMGFRGEALASIVAVSQVELTTRRAIDELGTRIAISGSQLEEQEPVAAPAGSNFKVKNLFYNIPARRKFLKSIQTEFNNIVTEFERVALINYGIDFSLKHNDSEVMSLRPSSFRKRILDLFGKRVNSQLIEVEVCSSLINVKGFVSAPEGARKKGALQFFFVNGRYMRHPYFAKAVMEAYSKMIPAGEQIPFFLMLDVEPSRIDVNIHPTKTEIKFEDEHSLWKIIAAAVRESLGRFNAAPGFDFDVEEMPEIPVMNITNDSAPVSAPKLSYNPNYNPYRSISGEYNRQRDGGWEKLYEISKSDVLTPPEDYISDENAFHKAETFENTHIGNTAKEPSMITPEEYMPISQYKGQYILVPVKSGLMWIHQRRAHIRVLYEKFRARLTQQQGCIQRLLFPERLELTVNESVVLDGMSEELASLGFDVSKLGGGSYALNGIPVDAEGISPAKLLHDIVLSVLEDTVSAKEKLHECLALTMAREVAIVAGQVLSAEEMNTLVDDLFKSNMPMRTPDGKIIIYTMSDADINRNFSK
ncbi:MAG: DNA mismatch repair endonuclease MutL [Bacteroidaceae bacterium]|nr:DNA mismatch repair endonuclease MutL [Bacteroidaceae bacterium]